MVAAVAPCSFVGMWQSCSDCGGWACCFCFVVVSQGSLVLQVRVGSLDDPVESGEWRVEWTASRVE